MVSAKRILVQAGHVSPREPGFEGGTGTVREQELTAAIQKRLVALLKADDRFEPVPCPGDIPDGVKVDAALFLHGDGSANKAASGFCFGYPNGAVNERLARLIAVEFEKIPGHPQRGKDNYTGGLAGYYGYSRVPTPGPEVLIEHGFLTNPAEQKWLFANLGPLAMAEYRALCSFYNLLPRTNGVKDKRGIGFTVVGVDEKGRKRTITKTREPGRAVDKLTDWGARLVTVRKNRWPIKDTR
jgi:N-acetylmuramoyl-L-alanine amidase